MGSCPPSPWRWPHFNQRLLTIGTVCRILTLCMGPDFVCSIWLCFPLWKLVGSSFCSRRLQATRWGFPGGPFPCTMLGLGRTRTLPAFHSGKSFLASLDLLSSISSDSPRNSWWWWFLRSGPLVALFSHFQLFPFHMTYGNSPCSSKPLLSLSFCFLIFNSQSSFLFSICSILFLFLGGDRCLISTSSHFS